VDGDGDPQLGSMGYQLEQSIGDNRLVELLVYLGSELLAWYTARRMNLPVYMVGITVLSSSVMLSAWRCLIPDPDHARADRAGWRVMSWRMIATGMRSTTDRALIARGERASRGRLTLLTSLGPVALVGVVCLRVASVLTKAPVPVVNILVGKYGLRRAQAIELHRRLTPDSVRLVSSDASPPTGRRALVALDSINDLGTGQGTDDDAVDPGRIDTVLVSIKHIVLLSPLSIALSIKHLVLLSVQHCLMPGCRGLQFSSQLWIARPPKVVVLRPPCPAELPIELMHQQDIACCHAG
jgi:hypothetical protein